MKPINDFENVKAAEGGDSKPQAGGYVCVITSVTDVPDREYLLVEFDIAEGPHAGYCSERAGRFGNWPSMGRTYRSYKGSAVGMFKAFVKSVEESPENKGYAWDWNEKKLAGKSFGAVLGEEEFLGQDGSVRTGLKLVACKTTDQIRSGDFRVPAVKKLKESERPAASGAFTDVTTDDIPF
jgi:hypothetical protein